MGRTRAFPRAAKVRPKLCSYNYVLFIIIVDKRKGGRGYDRKQVDDFIDKLLEIFIEVSIQLKKSTKTMEESRRKNKDTYINIINQLNHQHQRAIQQKDQEINDLKKLYAVLMREEDLSGPISRINDEREHVKTEESDENFQLLIAKIEAIREVDYIIYNKALNMHEK